MDDGFRHSVPQEADRFVDGLMSADEAASFERRMADDVALRADVESLRAVDIALRRYLGDWRDADPPVRIDMVATGLAGRGRAGRRGWFGGRGALLAASVVLVFMLAGAFVLLRQPGPGAEALYQREIASGFRPMWVCDTDREFARWTNNILRQPLVPVSDMPEGVRTLGWSRAGDESPLSKRAALMLAEHNGERILVVVDRLENDERVRVSKDSGLHVFRKELGPLVLYELSPLASPAALDALRLAPPDIFERGS